MTTQCCEPDGHAGDSLGQSNPISDAAPPPR
jgi:hypothetical protein